VTLKPQADTMTQRPLPLYPRPPWRQRYAAAALAATACAAVLAAGKPQADAAEARYQRERATCLSGQSNQDRATCLQEAEAARADLKRSPAGPPADALNVNAAKRCEGLPAAEMQDCQARMKGAGSRSGSAAGGGIIRELVTPVAVSAAPAASAASAASAAAPPASAGRAIPGIVPPSNTPR